MRLAGRLGQLLRVRLFTKILVANAIFVTLAALVGALAGAVLASGSGREALAVAIPVVLTGLVLTILVDAVILQLALEPLHSLQQAAERVRQGDLTVRGPHSALADRDLGRLVVAFNDALERLVLYRRKLRESADRAIRREEEERHRVAHALHEDTAQRLAALLLRLRMAAGQSDALEGLLEETRDEIAAALDVIRGYAVARRPRVLDELGLEAAVDAYANELADTGLQIEVEAEQIDRNPPLELDLYSIVREALDNVAEHSAAEHAVVRIARDSGAVSVSVEDDGRGFDVDAALSGNALGLFEMRERARAAGGRLAIDSRPGAGTRIQATVEVSGRPVDG